MEVKELYQFKISRFHLWKMMTLMTSLWLGKVLEYERFSHRDVRLLWVGKA